MSNQKPDMDLLKLAGIAKTDLRKLDNQSVGGTPHADHIDMRRLAGIDDPRRRPQGGGQGQPRRPNLLKGLDFVEAPVSRPIGRVDMDGSELPPMPMDTPPEFITPPEDLHESVLNQIKEPDQPEGGTVDVSQKEFKLFDHKQGFDLFQHAIIKGIIDDLTKSIEIMEASLEKLKAKKEKLIDMMLGGKDG